MNHPGDETRPAGPRPFWRSRAGVTLLVFLGIAAFYLLTEHTAHLLGGLPYLLVLACPLMHLFMHGGHSRHAGHGPPEDSRSVR
jgi:hypothetical protein